MQIWLIYTPERLLISKKSYADWREIQAEYEDFMTSLGPWSAELLLEFLESEYPQTGAGFQGQIAQLLHSAQLTRELIF